MGLHRRECRRRLGGGSRDLGEQDLVGLLGRRRLDSVANAEVADVEQRQNPAADEQDVPREADPLEHRVGVVGEKIERARLEVTGVDRFVELNQPQRQQGREGHPREADVE